MRLKISLTSIMRLVGEYRQMAKKVRNLRMFIEGPDYAGLKMFFCVENRKFENVKFFFEAMYSRHRSGAAAKGSIAKKLLKNRGPILRIIFLRHNCKHR